MGGAFLRGQRAAFHGKVHVAGGIVAGQGRDIRLNGTALDRNGSTIQRINTITGRTDFTGTAAVFDGKRSIASIDLDCSFITLNIGSERLSVQIEGNGFVLSKYR